VGEKGVLHGDQGDDPTEQDDRCVEAPPAKLARATAHQADHQHDDAYDRGGKSE
jgi:hypothetical protein